MKQHTVNQHAFGEKKRWHLPRKAPSVLSHSLRPPPKFTGSILPVYELYVNAIASSDWLLLLNIVFMRYMLLCFLLVVYNALPSFLPSFLPSSLSLSLSLPLSFSLSFFLERREWRAKGRDTSMCPDW